jgi:hypothetical protein
MPKVELREIGAFVVPSKTASSSARSIAVDAEFALTFVTPDGAEQRWSSGLAYCDIALQVGERALREQLEFQARSAAADLVADLAEAGYRASGAVSRLPIKWEIDERLPRELGER